MSQSPKTLSQEIVKSTDNITITKFSEEVYSFFIDHYSSLVVIGAEGVLITDPANSVRAGILKDEIGSVTNKKVTHIVLSHEHYDHTGGTEIFENASIAGHQFMNIFFEIDTVGTSPRQLDLKFDRQLDITMGDDITVQLLYYGPGDGVTSTVVYLPRQKIVYTADMYLTAPKLFGLEAALDDVNLLGTKIILNKILNELNVDFAVESHSPKADLHFMKAYANFYNDLFDYCKKWIEKTKMENKSVFAETLNFARSAHLPGYEKWQNYHMLQHYVRRMVMSIHHGG